MGQFALDSDGDTAWVEPVSVLAGLADEPYTLLMHGGGEGEQGRLSYLCAFPRFTVEGKGAGVFEQARAASHRLHLDSSRFSGGFAGLFFYELAATFERLDLPQNPGWPDLALGWYPAVAVFDHADRQISILGEPAARLRLAHAINTARGREVEAGPAGSLAPVWSEADYLHAAQRAVEYVRAGDVFQINLSHPFRGQIAGADAPLRVFERLVRQSPAAFSAYFRLDADRAIVTNSPERFVRLDEGGRVQTRPIKGTRPRGRTIEEDARLASELLASDKDRAENLMIVDLMRNDLSRVCKPGSVNVPELFSVERYSNVHHLVSTVEGELEPDRDGFDLVAASFPPGSITGAPKARAMEIIAELEGEARGPYCGALGWVSDGRRADLNVMIRTLSFVRDQGGWALEARSGGAITIDSDPQDELAETHAKIAALKRAVEAT